MLDKSNYPTESIISSVRFDKEEDYWINRLSGDLEKTHFLYDFRKVSSDERIMKSITFRLNEELFTKMKKITRASDLKIYVILVAGIVELLGQYTGNSDIIVGAPIYKQETGGEFVNTVLALRNSLEPHMTFKELLLQVRQTVMEANENANYPMETLLYRLKMPVSGNDFPLFDVAILLENIHLKRYIEHIPISMIFSFFRTDQDLEGRLEYDSALYENRTAERIMGHFTRLLEAALDRPGSPLSTLEILSEEEKKQVLADFNAETIEFPMDQTIHRLFESRVEEVPGNTAVVYENCRLTYRELSEKANALAYRLREKGVGPDIIVGIMAVRSPGMIIGMLGILKAGGAYLPIDPAYPQERIDYMLKDSGAKLLVTTNNKEGEKVRRWEGEIYAFSASSAVKNLLPATGHWQPATSLAYVIYTSGTTGNPKGVLVLHRGFINLIFYHRQIFGESHRSRMSQVASVGFDAMAFEVWPCLTSGASLYIADNDTRIDPLKMKEWLIDNKITISFQPTMMGEQLLKEDWPDTGVVLKALRVAGDMLISYPTRAYPFRFYNLYGPTEDTVWTTWAEVPVNLSSRKFPTIGKPVGNHSVFILGSGFKPQPVGVAGELCISGIGLARGYLNQPELTAEKFIMPSATRGSFEKPPLDPAKLLFNHYSPITTHHSPIYRTGDLARWLPQGAVEFLGRIDRQVKIRGFRIELGEIESRLSAHKGIKDAVVIAVGGIAAGETAERQYLCAYIVSDYEIPASELRQYLARELPEYMIPSFFVQIEKIPLTPNGKVDRKVLPGPEIKSTVVYVPPRDELEETLVEIWSEILGVENSLIGIDANFFELGGHSLKATILMANIHKELDVKVPLVVIFKTPTIRGLAEYIENSGRNKYLSIEPIEEREYYAPSSAQKRLYILYQLAPDAIGYNIPGAIPLLGEPDVEKMETTFKELINRHESLRTSFEMIAEHLVQRVHEFVEFKVEARVEAAVEAGGGVSIMRDFIRPFDLSCAPLLRAGLLKTGDSKHFLLVDMHHIISDGVSHAILVRDFMALCRNEELPRLRLQYKDFTQWQNMPEQRTAIKKQETYWLKEYAGDIPVLELPTDYVRPTFQGFEGETVSFGIPGELIRMLKKITLAEEVTLYMVLLSIHVVLLWKISGQEDLIVGTPVAGRRHADLAGIIGMFVNTLVLRNYPQGEKSFTGFLQEVKHRTLEAFDNQEYQFEDLVEQVAVTRDTGRNPLFDVMFSLQNVAAVPDAAAGPETTPPPEPGQHHYKNASSKFDMVLTALDSGNNLFFNLTYNTALFRRKTIDRFICYFNRILLSVTTDLEIILSQIDIMSEEEKQQVLYRFNETEVYCPADKTIHALFEEQAEKTPDSVAVVGAAPRGRPDSATLHLTYKELNEKSDRLTSVLREKGVLPDSIVGIMAERSPEMIIGISGILKAGGAYMPISPDYPRERIDYILKDSNAVFLFTGNELSGIFKDTSKPSPLERGASLAYIIYTSGTTGTPKGVLVEHRNVVNLVCWFGKQYRLKSGVNMLQLSDYTFDASVNQVFGPLLHGAAVCLVHKDMVADIEALRQYITEKQINIINFIPGLLKQLLGGWEKPRCLQVVLSGAQVLEDKLKDDILRQGYRLYNQYGPTEATVDALTQACCFDDEVTLGRPIFNMRAYILDPSRHLLPVGVVGELWVSGAGVARGYLNRPERTADLFVPDPFRPGNMMYGTGDLAKWRPDGQVRFVGRKDHQVKIRGYRIELAEIENCLLKHQKVREAIVLAREDAGGEKYLCAYIIPGDEALGTEALRNYLSETLPNYMIPSYFVQLEKMPVTLNGKLDRKALPEPEAEAGEEYSAPRNKEEEKIVVIWQTVLGRDKVGINDNFFTIGGDSIKAIQIASRMKSAGYKVEVKDIFKYSSISELASKIKKVVQITDQSAITGVVSLTPIQEEFFAASGIDPYHFNQAVMLYSKEGFEKDAITAIFVKILEHHDALRMTYRNEGEEVIQTNHGLDYPFSLVNYDLRGQEQENAREELRARINEVQASIDLENGPLMKLGLFHLADGDRLLIVIHHLVIDGVSWRILFEDINTLFQQYKKKEQLVLPLKTDSFKVWAEKLSEYANSELFLKEKAYWAELESTEVPGIKKDFETEDNYVRDAASRSFGLSVEETGLLLTRANKAFGTEINDILLSALGLSLKKSFGVGRVLVALEGHGREEIFPDNDVDISRTVGWFTSLFPVIFDFSYEADPARQIKEVKECLRRVPNKGIGYGMLKYLTAKEHKEGLDFKLNPRISFNYLGQFDADVEQVSYGIARESVGNSRSVNRQREHELDVSGMITNKQLVMTITYNKYQFKPETMDRLLEDYKIALSHIISFCSSREEKELTPGDLMYKEFSIEEVDTLRKQYVLEDIYPLSPMQEGMYFHYLYDRASLAYFEQFSYRHHGKLEIKWVEKSLNELFKRHDILRTNFLQTGNQILQVLQKEKTIAFYYEDISNRKDKFAYLTDYKEKDKKNSFELHKDPLMRVSVIRVGEGEYEFTWSFHHIITDGWCIGIFISEYSELYNSLRENRPGRLPAAAPYRTYIAWLEKQDKETSARYWETYLGGYEEAVGVPKFRSSGGSIAGYKEEKVIFSLDGEKTSGLNRLAGRNQVTLNTVVQAAWGIILGRYNDKTDVVFGAVVSGRPPEVEGVESMVGLFINTIPVRIAYNGVTKITDLLKVVQNAAVESEPHHYYPLARIQSRSLLKQNLLDHILAFENYPLFQQSNGIGDEEKEKNDGPALRISNLEVFEQTNYDFNVIIAPGDRLVIKLSYNANVYPRDFVERIPHHLSLLLDQVLTDATLTINDLTLLSADEKQQVLYDFNNTEMEYPKDKTIHELFAEQAARVPDGVAVIGVECGAESLEQIVGAQGAVPLPMAHISITYKELNKKSNQLARLLRDKGVGPDSIVGLIAERSIEIIIGILGILKAGGAYLPIDPGYPQERIQYMLADSKAEVLLAAPAAQVKVAGDSSEGIEIIDISNRLFSSISTSTYQVSSANLAYVIYTSGTTGKSKGTLISHTNVIRVTRNTNYIDILEQDRILQLSNYAFDGSVFDIFGTLLNGAALVMINKEDVFSVDNLAEVIKKDDITVFFVTTALFNTLIDLRIDCLDRVRKVLFGGELVSVEHSKRALEYMGKERILHVYGPTETTVYASYYPVNEIEEGVGTVPIGRPIANTTVYILDNHLNPVPTLVCGEIYIGGDGVSRGYLNNPELTVETFILAHSSWLTSDRREKKYGSSEKLPVSCLYKTGDLARWLPDGNIEFAGRLDHQVKIRGFRVELGEIENRLLTHQEIKEAIVVSREDKQGTYRYLCAYFVSERELSTARLREYLSTSLPDYMIPSYLVQIDRIPLTANGKADRKALPVPESRSGAEGYITPRDVVELQLVEIWSDVLNIDKENIGIDTNFFELGGHSLKATILVSRIHKEFNVKVPLAEIFKAPTIRRTAEYIKGTLGDKYISIEAVEEKEYYTLSPAQKRMYAFHQMVPGNIVYNIPLVISLPVDADRQKLKNVFKRLIARHESLRTSFQIISNKPVQRIHDEVKFEIEYYDLTAKETHHSSNQFIINHFIRPFDLANAPLLRAGLIETANREHILMLDIHHIITDGVSQDILQKEFIALWWGEELPPNRLCYKDYTGWLNGKEHRELLRRQEEYWRREFPGKLPVLNLPTDYPRPKMRSFEGRSLVFILEKEKNRMLKELAQKEGATMYMILLAVFNILLYKLCRQEDIIIGTVTAGRRHADLQNIIGFFINPLALRNYPSGEKSFMEFLREVISRTLQTFDNQDYQYDDLVELAVKERDPGRNPIFDVLFALQNQPGQPGNSPEEAPPGNREPFEFKLNRSLFDMNFVAVEAGGILKFVCEYNTRLFKEETIKRFIEYFKEIVTSVLDHNRIRLQDIKISHGLAVTTKDTPEMDFGF